MSDETPGPPMVGDAAFRTDLPGAPLTVEALADSLARRALPAFDEAARVTGAARAGLVTEWQGLSAQRSHTVVDELSSRAQEARAEAAGIVDRLRAYADRLRTAQRGLADLRRDAAAAGLLVADSVVSAPPGRDCDLAPYLQRATQLYRHAVLDGSDLPGAPAGPSDLGLLMLAPGAAAEVRAGQWTTRAGELRLRADALGDTEGGRRLAAGADDLEGAGKVLTRGTSVATLPIGVLVDEANGESWEQATTSQGAGLIAGSLASAGAATAMTSWTGPGAVVAGVIAFGAGVVGGMAADAAVDARYESAARRGTPAGLLHRCGGPGGRERRSPPPQSKYGQSKYGAR